jgi:hypothetical protein
MTPRSLVTAAAVALAMLAGSQPAQAQTAYDFKVPFNFVARGKTFTAGQYIMTIGDQQEVLTLQARDPKNGAVAMPVETRISETKPMNEPEIVFDKLNGKYVVSELLVPADDGYLLQVTKEKHTHESVKGSKAMK